MKIESRAASWRFYLVVAPLLLLCTAIAHANSQMAVDAAGRVVGYWVSQSGICNDASTMPVYNPEGYLACFMDTGFIDSSLQPPGTFGTWEGGFFSTPDCSGLFTQYATQVAGQTEGGYVVASSQGLMFAEIGAPNMTPVISSMWVGAPESGSCVPISPPIQYPAAVLLFPSPRNGSPFNPSPYRPPFSVESLPNTAVFDVIFFDSLDAEY
jgi:hypothetical protein